MHESESSPSHSVLESKSSHESLNLAHESSTTTLDTGEDDDKWSGSGRWEKRLGPYKERMTTNGAEVCVGKKD